MTDQELSRLTLEAPGWRIWQAAGGTDMATRRKPLPDDLLRDGRLAQTLMAGKYEKPLAEQLAAQAAIEYELTQGDPAP